MGGLAHVWNHDQCLEMNNDPITVASLESAQLPQHTTTTTKMNPRLQAAPTHFFTFLPFSLAAVFRSNSLGLDMKLIQIQYSLNWTFSIQSPAMREGYRITQ